MRRTQGSAGPRFVDLPEILTSQDLIAFLPIGRNAVYEALNSGTIKHIRVGQKFLAWISTARV